MRRQLHLVAASGALVAGAGAVVAVDPLAVRAPLAVVPPPEIRLVDAPSRVAALGRIEPLDGVLRIAGPSRPSAVVAELLVAEGDRVEAGAPLAVLDVYAADAARLRQAEAELASARTELARVERLFQQRVAAVSLRDEAHRRVAVAQAEVDVARATLALNTVRAPAAGRILRIHARAGERIGADGLLELGRTDAMYAVAEVYETEVTRVRPGQAATVHSPAFDAPLAGSVERVGMLVRKQRVLDVDPVADVDARVVEVHVRLAQGDRVAALSNLEVDVVIEAGQP